EMNPSDLPHCWKFSETRVPAPRDFDFASNSEPRGLDESNLYLQNSSRVPFGECCLRVFHSLIKKQLARVPETEQECFSRKIPKPENGAAELEGLSRPGRMRLVPM